MSKTLCPVFVPHQRVFGCSCHAAGLLVHLAGFLEEVIGSMAGQVPLKNIADIIMQQYGKDQWGDFKVLQSQRVMPALPLPLPAPPLWHAFTSKLLLPMQGILVGLLTACGAELSILKCANNVVAAGATIRKHGRILEADSCSQRTRGCSALGAC